MSKKSDKNLTTSPVQENETQSVDILSSSIQTEPKEKAIVIKLNRKVIIIASAALAVIIAATVFFCFFSPFKKAEPVDADISEEPSIIEEVSEPYNFVKNESSILGFWHIGEERTKELTINNITAETVHFSLWYQGQNSINDFVATVESNTASFTHKIQQGETKGTISGVLTFNEKEIIVDIKESDLPDIKTAKMTFTGRHFQSWENEFHQEGYKSGYIKTTVNSSVNVRSEASTSSKVVSSLNPGKGFYIINYAGEWCHVRLYDDENGKEMKGYVFAEYVTETRPEPRLETKTIERGGITFVYPTSYSDEYKDVKFTLFEIDGGNSEIESNFTVAGFTIKVEGNITGSSKYAYLNYTSYDKDGFSLGEDSLFAIRDNFKESRGTYMGSTNATKIVLSVS